MNIDITRLKNHSVNSINIDETYEFTEEQLKKSGILKLSNVKINGSLINSDNNEYVLNAVINGVMTLEDSLTLEPVEYPFSTEIDGNIDELLEEIGESSKKSEFSIDIFPIIWENILMEIPIRVAKDDASNIKLEGDGWKFVREGELTSTNPELEKLKDLLK